MRRAWQIGEHQGDDVCRRGKLGGFGKLTNFPSWLYLFINTFMGPEINITTQEMLLPDPAVGRATEALLAASLRLRHQPRRSAASVLLQFCQGWFPYLRLHVGAMSCLDQFNGILDGCVSIHLVCVGLLPYLICTCACLHHSLALDLCLALTLTRPLSLALSHSFCLSVSLSLSLSLSSLFLSLAFALSVYSPACTNGSQTRTHVFM